MADLIIAGIDPGASGAMAIIGPNRRISVFRFSKMTLPELWREMQNRWDIDICYLEKVNAMPGQGVSTMFEFGKNYGRVEALLTAAEIPFEYVTPQVWQRTNKLGKRYPTQSARKRAHKERAQQLTAELVTLDMADAILIANHGVIIS